MTEILFTGGCIRPHADSSAVPGMLVRDQRIVVTGTDDECRSRALGTPTVVELDGHTVLPGFVDAHCHPLMHGQFSSWVDCSWEAAPTIDAVVERLSTSAAKRQGAVRGRGFHHGNVGERRLLTRYDLDRVAVDREVLVFHSSGHGAMANSATLQAMGVGPDTPDPPGGHFGRDADGTPDGTVWDAAADWLTGRHGVKIANNGPNFHLPDDPAALQANLVAALSEMHSRGVTTVVDAQVTSREMSTYLRLRRDDGLHMRVEMLVISSLVGELEALGVGGRFGDDQLAIAGVKLYADGALTAATARFSEPYCCSPTDFGYLYHPSGELEGLIRRVRDLGLPTATHAQGDAAIQLVLEAHADLGDHGGLRHRIEHFGVPTAEQVQQAAQLGLWPVTQPQYLLRYGDELVNALGSRADRVIPLGEIRDAGVPVVISSDAPVCPPHPMEAVAAAVQRRTLAGRRLGAVEQCLTVEQALKAHTLTAAAAAHRESAVGSLDNGKFADLVVLEHDPLTSAHADLAGIQVEQTWIGGRQVFARNSSTTRGIQ